METKRKIISIMKNKKTGETRIRRSPSDSMERKLPRPKLPATLKIGGKKMTIKKPRPKTATLKIGGKKMTIKKPKKTITFKTKSGKTVKFNTKK